jgi:hypothetical protein
MYSAKVWWQGVLGAAVLGLAEVDIVKAGTLLTC